MEPMTGQKKIGIVGCGTIGRRVATELDTGSVPGARLVGLSSRDTGKAQGFAASLRDPPPVLSLAGLVPLVDLVVEAATGAALDEIARATLGQGKDLMVLSCGALLNREDLLSMARDNGAAIYVPSGAIAGLDGVASAAAGQVDSISIVTRKPPAGLRGAPGITRAGVDLDSVTEPVVVYEGPVREACRLFPANVNVSAALSLAGIGPDETTIRIYADPTVTRNTHEIVVTGAFGRLAMKIENVPEPTNPRTGMLSALSTLAALKRLTSPLRVGT